MIKSINVTNYVGESIDLELMRPDKTGFIITSISGLGPTKATINTTSLAVSDGALYNSAYLTSRSIVMSIQFMETDTETIEDIRHKSYKYFPIKKRIEMVIVTDNRSLKTEGYIEANEPTIFSDKEGCSITINCPDPYLYSLIKSETVFSGIHATFEFPFENNSLADPLMELGTIETRQEAVVFNRGDAEIGMTIHIHAIGDASNVTIYNLANDKKMRINMDILKGDTITIVTLKGKKSITLLREGKKRNILNALDKGGDWFTLVRGDNLFAYRAETGVENLQFRVVNNIIYEGA